LFTQSCNKNKATLTYLHDGQEVCSRSVGLCPPSISATWCTCKWKKNSRY